MGRRAHCAVATDTMIVITGGRDSRGSYLSTVETYTPGEVMAVRMTGEMREVRYYHGCTSYDTGVTGETVVMVAGGYERKEVSSVERMTVTLDGTGTWEILSI